MPSERASLQRHSALPHDKRHPSVMACGCASVNRKEEQRPEGASGRSGPGAERRFRCTIADFPVRTPVGGGPVGLLGLFDGEPCQAGKVRVACQKRSAVCRRVLLAC